MRALNRLRQGERETSKLGSRHEKMWTLTSSSKRFSAFGLGMRKSRRPRNPQQADAGWRDDPPETDVVPVFQNADGTAPVPPTIALTPQGETIVRRLPEAQPGEPVVEPGTEFWPESADDIFAGGRLVVKLLGLKIKMFVLPGGERAIDPVAEGKKT